MADIVRLLDLKLGDIISFNTFGVNIINNINNGILKGIVSGDNLLNPSLAAVNHANIYSSLPITPTNPIPDNFTEYNYLTIKDEFGDIIEIGEPWVNSLSLTRQVRTSATLIIGDFNPDDRIRLIDILNANGFLNIIMQLN